MSDSNIYTGWMKDAFPALNNTYVGERSVDDSETVLAGFLAESLMLMMAKNYVLWTHMRKVFCRFGRFPAACYVFGLLNG